MVVPAVIAAVVTLLSIPLLARSTLVTPLIMFLALAAAAINVAASRVPFVVLRAGQRLRGFMALTGISAIATSLASAFAVLVLHTGVIGWLTAVVVANLVELGLAMWIVPFRWREGFDRARVIETLRLGIPLVPHYAAQWSLQLADRLLLAALVGAPALGVYALGSNIAVPVMVLLGSVSQALLPSYARAGTDRSGLSELPGTILLQVGIVGIVTIAGALLAPPVNSPTYAG